MNHLECHEQSDLSNHIEFSTYTVNAEFAPTPLDGLFAAGFFFAPHENALQTLTLGNEGPALARHEPDGGRAAFAAIVEEHWTAVYRTLFTLCGNAHDTEDLTQETFLRALNRLSSFRPGTRMRPWLLRIATNAFFDARRKRLRARVKPLEGDPPAAVVRPEHALEVAEESTLLKAALEELSETTRLVFHLRATEDLSFREIAKLVGTTEQAARWHMHQARTRLLARLGTP
jgi:RNA polymerase sigma-70 factor, ECF subfamily